MRTHPHPCGQTTHRQSRLPLLCVQGVTGQETTHVVFFKHTDLTVESLANLKRQPFNASNPGALELCTCNACGAPIMLDDKQGRIRAIVPNLMGYDAAHLPATYHAFVNATARRPTDGLPAYEGLRPEFEWPAVR